jgi:hypothetical protein
MPGSVLRTLPIRKSDKAARELEADEDEKHWEERLSKVAKQKPTAPESGQRAGSDPKAHN